MIPLRIALCSVLLLCFAVAPGSSSAQPSLPNMTFSADKGTVTVIWNCQYYGVKAITVMRATDSTGRFTTIGQVKKLDKGVQAFTDIHPLPGRSFYKLNIRFISGLSWSSNNCRVDYGNNEAPAQQKNSAPAMSFDGDTITYHITPKKPETEKPKVSLVPEVRELPESNVVLSRYIFINPITGHVAMKLPADVQTHHYSIVFTDDQNNTIVDVPRLNASAIVLDKRNFSRKGRYKFELKKDGLQLESGSVEIK